MSTERLTDLLSEQTDMLYAKARSLDTHSLVIAHGAGPDFNDVDDMFRLFTAVQQSCGQVYETLSLLRREVWFAGMAPPSEGGAKDGPARASLKRTREDI
jgi:hypothetical protein